MPTIGPRCHELRIKDGESGKAWRIIHRLDSDAVVIADVFAKKTRATPDHVIDTCKRRFNKYDGR